MAPEDGVGIITFTNGSKGATAWIAIELGRLLHNLLDIPDDSVRSDVPHHPELWGDFCGRYQLPPRISDLRQRMMMGGGAEVFVRGGQLIVRVLAPIPALSRGFPLHPDDEQDPYVFRLDLSRFGMPTARVVFGPGVGARTTAIHTDFVSHPLSLYTRPTTRRPRGRFARALGALAVATAVTAVRRHRGRPGKGADSLSHIDRSIEELIDGRGSRQSLICRMGGCATVTRIGRAEETTGPHPEPRGGNAREKRLAPTSGHRWRSHHELRTARLFRRGAP